ncbi:hypothetical protein M436DRAFT_48068 [Aureobasidium namibiae CBS 147.97]|uniref:Allergen n=1 Tax=Aureobasidium namibiae CBS 147.97 TaxID=1043004 RepID=A0A074WSG6_9PEZI|nr:uncharacterized protein M436DRAFT_48068 [Aureobasidium namibiae CBS 147.97]KEQ72677.1 hypothetical protein M436DRAFT_48068 [Aureobasidium namibiae CBS 147.97]
MDSAKAAVKEFMSKSGHHDTTVHEKVAPAVTHESHQLQQHEQIQTAIDKEVHQDHYHTSIQPIKDREVLPEQHHHNLAAVEHRSFEHGNDAQVKERLAAEAAQFRDQRIEVEAVHSKSIAPTIGGEHIHHHVHETIQPVVNKETIEPHVVHTTVPIHEVHHNAAQHHSASALPAVSMADFKKQGGVLTGREERYDGFEGEPRTVGGSHTSTSSTGLTGSGITGSHSHTGTGLTGSHTNTTGRETLGERPSLMQKLNPKVDADGDGKAGFMK